MKELLKISWIKLLSEGIVIVASILLAFAIDAWWTERQENQIEIQFMSALAIDLNSTYTRAARFREILEARGEALVKAQIEFGNSSQGDEIKLLEHLWPIGLSRTLEISSATLENINANGGFQTISNPDIQLKLTTLIDRIGYFHQDDLERVNFWNEKFAPYTMQHAQIYKLVARQDSFVQLPAEASDFNIPANLDAFYGNLELSNMLFMQIVHNQQTIIAIDIVIDRIAELVGIIEIEYGISE